MFHVKHNEGRRLNMEYYTVLKKLGYFSIFEDVIRYLVSDRHNKKCVLCVDYSFGDGFICSAFFENDLGNFNVLPDTGIYGSEKIVGFMEIG